MKRRLQENWKEYLSLGLIGLWIIAFFAILEASSRAGCSDGAPLSETRGLCLARRIAELSCVAGYLGAWAFIGSIVAKAKGRNPIIGWILGFTLQFMGCLLMMSWEPRKDNLGRMIGWDEYKHLNREQRKAIRPHVSPEEMKRKRIANVVLIIGLILVVLVAILSEPHR